MGMVTYYITLGNPALEVEATGRRDAVAVHVSVVRGPISSTQSQPNPLPWTTLPYVAGAASQHSLADWTSICPRRTAIDGTYRFVARYFFTSKSICLNTR